MKKQLSRFVVALIAGMLICLQTSAKDVTKVTVTLKGGQKVSGVMKSYWFGSLKKAQNENFSIVKTDGETMKFNAKDIEKVVLKDEPADGGERTFESCDVAVPVVTNPNRVLTWILGLVKTSTHAKIYWYNALVQNTSYGGGAAGIPGRLTYSAERGTVFCIKFHDNPTAYPFYYPGDGDFNISVMTHHLKKRNPELGAYMKDYFKKNRQMKKEIEKQPERMLDVYEAFLNK